MEVRCEIIEEAHDDLLCNDWQEWADEVRINVWVEDEDNGALVIDENARRNEIAKRAYFRWLHGSKDERDNWLQAEKEVDKALFD